MERRKFKRRTGDEGVTRSKVLDEIEPGVDVPVPPKARLKRGFPEEGINASRKVTARSPDVQKSVADAGDEFVKTPTEKPTAKTLSEREAARAAKKAQMMAREKARRLAEKKARLAAAKAAAQAEMDAEIAAEEAALREAEAKREDVRRRLQEIADAKKRADEERRALELEALAIEEAEKAEIEEPEVEAPVQLGEPIFVPDPEEHTDPHSDGIADEEWDDEDADVPQYVEPRAANSVQANWDSLRDIPIVEAHLERKRVVTATRTDPAHTTFDVLRTRLLQAVQDKKIRRVAITSPTKDCGKTFTASNLALSLARQENFRTLLLDFDLRNPSLHKVFGLKNPGSIGDVLRGKVLPQDHLRCLGDNMIHVSRKLAIGFNDQIESYASELLQDSMTESVLQEIEADFEPDIVLFDLPPALYYDDVIALKSVYDAVLLVIGGGTTTPKEIKQVEQRLGADTPLLGCILNNAEGVELERYSY